MKQELIGSIAITGGGRARALLALSRRRVISTINGGKTWEDTCVPADAQTIRQHGGSPQGLCAYVWAAECWDFRPILGKDGRGVELPNRAVRR